MVESDLSSRYTIPGPHRYLLCVNVNSKNFVKSQMKNGHKILSMLAIKKQPTPQSSSRHCHKENNMKSPKIHEKTKFTSGAKIKRITTGDKICILRILYLRISKHVK